MDLIEKVIDDLNTYLQANLPAKLATVQADYTDGITLPDIVVYHIAEQPEYQQFPVLLMLGDDTDNDEQSAAWFKARHNITIVCMTSDQNTTTLKRKLYRYVRAITELCMGLLSAWGQRVPINRLNYSPIYGKDGIFLSDASITISVPKVEN
jgi:hypothetical protein